MWDRRAFGRGTRSAVAFFGALLTLGVASGAAADGEAGLVLQDGDAVATYCIAFEGDGIRGDELLRAAGQTFDAYGGGSGLAVCSIDDRGCQDAGSFSSCFCECQGSSCTYWAFFTRSYGKNWVYSTLAFNLLEAKDGDIHGWKWGAGSPSSAPSPQDITFEQICGHAPRGGVDPTQPPPPPPPPPPAAGGTSAPVVTPAVTALAETPPGAAPSATASQPPLVTITGSVPTTGASATAPQPPASGEEPGGDGSGDTSLVVFGVLAAGLVALLGAGLVWRSRRGI